MAALDFPNAPTSGQLFVAPNGATYRWDGTTWVIDALAGAGTPSGPAGGDLAGAYPNPVVGPLKIDDSKISGVAWGKVAGAPTSFPPSGLAGGDLTGSYPAPFIADGAVDQAALDPTVLTQLMPLPVFPGDQGKVLTSAPGTGLPTWLTAAAATWTVTPGVSITPVDALATIVAAPISTALRWGPSTLKSRLIADGNGAGWLTNAGFTNALDDPARTAWRQDFSTLLDFWAIQHSVPGANATWAVLMSLTGQGILTVNGVTPHVAVGNATVKARLTAHPTNQSTASLTCNGWTNAAGNIVLDDPARGSWLLNFNNQANPANDTATIGYFPPGPGSLVTHLRFDPDGNVYSPHNLVLGTNLTAAPSLPGISLEGGTSGLRCALVGGANVAADGLSNAIAFGYGGGFLKLRVDATSLGSITVTASDAALKLEVLEDVPGLDAVLQLRPVSFAYDQTKCAVGFPPGRHYGLIAQEASAYAPLVVMEEGEYLGIDYGKLVPVLIQAIQDLAAQVAALKETT